MINGIYLIAICFIFPIFRYIVKDILGQGTFGQVAKCWVAELDCFVAVKVIKNQPAYYQQALVEVSILTTVSILFWLGFRVLNNI